MKMHEDQFELGTKVYRYTLKYEDGEYKIRVKEGEVQKKIYKYLAGLSEERGKKICYDEHDSTYFRPNKDSSLLIDECHGGVVYLLENNPQRAMELFIEAEEKKIASLYEEIENRKNKLNKMKGN